MKITTFKMLREELIRQGFYGQHEEKVRLGKKIKVDIYYRGDIRIIVTKIGGSKTNITVYINDKCYNYGASLSEVCDVLLGKIEKKKVKVYEEDELLPF